MHNSYNAETEFAKNNPISVWRSANIRKFHEHYPHIISSKIKFILYIVDLFISHRLAILYPDCLNALATYCGLTENHSNIIDLQAVFFK